MKYILIKNLVIVDASIKISFFVKCRPKDVYRWPCKHGFKKASNAFYSSCITH